MPRIKWVEPEEATGQLAAIYAAEGGRLPDIIKTMTHRPDFMEAIGQAARMHFSDGALSRAQHEMIASYVAALNRCHYWLSSHAWFLQLQGEQYTQAAAAIRAGDLDGAGVTPAERLLLELVGTVARHAYRVTDAQVQGLREAGWSDAQIAEAVYDAALFSLFVRLADAFDIHPPSFMDPDGPPTVLAGDARA